MLNLASIRYSSVLSRNGGPVDSLEEGQIDVFGTTFFQANARLKAGLTRKKDSELYSNADGTGMGRSPSVARHIAISEALERWAYNAAIESREDTSRYAFHLDPSSNGFAAFPGLFVYQARQRAKFEAIERVILLHWWENRLDGTIVPTEWPNVHAIRFEPHLGATVVILVSEIDNGVFSYGFAAASNFARACHRAALELRRHQWTTKSWNSKETPSLVSNSFERRSLHFSSAKGHQEFMNRVKRKVGSIRVSLERVCDQEVKGPWSQYTTVWRMLFMPPSLEAFKSSDDYFYW